MNDSNQAATDASSSQDDDTSDQLSIVYNLTRHHSLLSIYDPQPLDQWAEAKRLRSVSVPDLHRLYDEWQWFQSSDCTKLLPCHLQVDVLNAYTDTPLSRPAMKVKMGAVKYRTARSQSPTGNWNEGFLFVVSYHAQLFNTIELDLYDIPRKHWPKHTRHIGKAKIKLSRLKSRPEVFTAFIPLYEYKTRPYLPTDIGGALNKSSLWKNTMSRMFGESKVVGTVQVRIRYQFQNPYDTAAAFGERVHKFMIDDQRSSALADHGQLFGYDITNLTNDSHDHQERQRLLSLLPPTDASAHRDLATSSSSLRNRFSSLSLTDNHRLTDLRPANLSPSASSASLSSTTHPTKDSKDIVVHSQHGRGDLARDESHVDDLFNTRLQRIMSQACRGPQRSCSTSSRRSRPRRPSSRISRLSPLTSPISFLPSRRLQHRDQPASAATAAGSSSSFASSILSPSPTSPASKRLPSQPLRFMSTVARPHGQKSPTAPSTRAGRKQPSPSSNTSRRSSSHSSAPSAALSSSWFPTKWFWKKSSNRRSTHGKRYGFHQKDMDDISDRDATSQLPPRDRLDDDATDPFTSWSTASSIDTAAPESGQPASSSTHPVAACNNKNKQCLTDKARKKAKHLISSVNFGDKRFGLQWMHDTFEEVALAHPIADHLIGLAVTRETQAMVRSIITLANSFGQGFKVTSIELVKAMLVLERFYRRVPKKHIPEETNEQYVVDVSNHYFRYALISYGWRGLVYLGSYGQLIRSRGKARSNRSAILNYLHLDPRDLLGYEYGLRQGAAFQPSYFVAVDRQRNTIVLSIRGTWSLYDAITDLVCYYVPWRGGLVHSGMLASAQWFFVNIVPQIFRYIHLHQDEIRGFVITGHSLGGGCASLLTMMVSEQIHELRRLANNPDFQLQCYSYAPVALVSYELACRYDDYVQSFIVQDDIVGRLSYGTAMKLKELVLDTVSAYEGFGGVGRILISKKSRDLFYDILAKCRSRIFDTNRQSDDDPPLLFIPGKIIHIQRRRVTRFGTHHEPHMSRHIPGASRSVFSIHKGSRDICNEMLVTKTAITDHTIGAYQDAFEKLSASYPISTI